ncbi:hypothetical protein FHS18_006299 [Paenibacillus phyllosphaerae]|uniref:Butirosin biosynthesis protein H N-terminal domain-containing protein n=1 Tax=Paenibacillus phyllosphaerae TaxID=274593 RepID=A0A7W5B593_9BACL|nr:hypothetical protein [Paenibacillus phyllosphaerae]MBB3114181.1 hypothetical protein [Paenibacillus phyllosphaerae]
MELTIEKVPRVDGDAGFMCMEDCIATIAGHLGRRYELYLLWNWTFHYHEEKVSDRIGDLFELRYRENVDDLKNFHGIAITKVGRRSSREVAYFLDSEDSGRMPVLVAFDAYWCPWDWGFQKYHNEHHHFIIVGVDQEAEQFICADPYFSKSDQRLPFELFDSGLTEVKLVTLSEPDPLSYAEVLGALVERANRFNNDETNRGMFLLIEEIDRRLDIHKEQRDCPDFIATPFHMGFVVLMEIRVGYSHALRFIGEQYESADMLALADQFWTVANQWMSVRRMLYKMDLMGETAEPIKQSVVRMMKEIARIEKELVERVNRLAREAA